VLDEPAAQWLVAHGVVLFGTDAPSVDARTSTTLPVHHALFSGGAYVLENLALEGVTPGRYELLAQPVRIEGADGAPVRAMLRRLVRRERG
jgi:arylformamidase